jgi:hypothetical protein
MLMSNWIDEAMKMRCELGKRCAGSGSAAGPVDRLKGREESEDLSKTRRVSLRSQINKSALALLSTVQYWKLVDLITTIRVLQSRILRACGDHPARD